MKVFVSCFDACVGNPNPNHLYFQNPKIQPTFNGWTDDGSGIHSFNVSVFHLQPTARNHLILSKSGSPVYGPSFVDITLNNFRWDCPRPGVYAIELTVYDRAGNYARARKIFNYIDKPSLLETQAPLFVNGTNPDSGLQWVTDLEVPQQGGSYFFTARWPRRFVSSLKPEWLLPVEEWNAAYVVDDKYGSKYGFRSTEALPNTTGVVAYEFGYAVDSVGGRGARIPSNLTFLEASIDPHEVFSVPQESLEKEGSTIVMWVNAYDFAGKKYTASSKVSVHRSFHDINITNAQFITQYKYQFNSR